MPGIEKLVEEFLSQKRFAVVGVSQDREDAANLIYRTLKSKDYEVYPVNPKIDQFKGEPCYANVQSLPEKVDGVVIVTSPAVSEMVVQDCIQAGISRVWMHNALGTSPRLGKEISKKIGSVSPEAVRLCKENGITVIPGSCPMQFIGDFGHACMRWFLRMSGAMKV